VAGLRTYRSSSLNLHRGGPRRVGVFAERRWHNGLVRCAVVGIVPNDTPATATPIAIGDTVDGSLCRGDVDVHDAATSGEP
jgi:hypothetical protein